MKHQKQRKVFLRGKEHVAVVGLEKSYSFPLFSQSTVTDSNQTVSSFVPVVPIVGTFGVQGHSQMESGQSDDLPLTSNNTDQQGVGEPAGVYDAEDSGAAIEGGDQISGFPPPWPLEIHRTFVQAVMDTGINHSSPAVIIENLSRPAPAEMNPERVKSHLQKYRKNREKSKSDFISEYDHYLHKAIALGSAGLARKLAEPSAILDIMGEPQPLGGESAALLTYSIKAEESKAQASARSAAPKSLKMPRSSIRKRLKRSSDVFVEHFAGTRVEVPQLTEKEKVSSLGMAINQTLALSQSLTRQIMAQRLTKRARMAKQLKENMEGEQPEMLSHEQNREAERETQIDSSSEDRRQSLSHDQPAYTDQLEGVNTAAEALLAASGRAIEQQQQQQQQQQAASSQLRVNADPRRDDFSSIEQNDTLWGRSIQPFDNNTAADFRDSACSSPVPPSGGASGPPSAAPQGRVATQEQNAVYGQMSFPQQGMQPPMSYEQLQELLRQQVGQMQPGQPQELSHGELNPQEQVAPQQQMQHSNLDFFNWKQSKGG